MKICLTSLVLSIIFFNVYAEKSYSNWRLAPDAETKLAEFIKSGADCRLKNNKTRFIPRAQLKYTLSKNDYIHRWFDRPLFQNSGLARFNKPDMRVNDVEAQAIKKALELGKCSAMASLLETSGRTSFFKTSLDNGITLHAELTSSRFRKSRDYIDIAGKMLNAPNICRFNNKPLITIYPPETDTSYVRELKKNIVKEHGDKFIIVPYVPFYNKHKFKKSRPLTAADIETMAEDLRNHLRISDGILIHGEHFNIGNRIDNAFGFKVMIPILHKIFSEDEFKDKFLGLGVLQGHENQYRWTFIRNSDGVATLRKELEFITALRPDICLLPEWDEVNENTCYRPMVNTGWSSLRMVRHFAEKIRGEKFTAFPHDDLTVPNMILCYRRRLLAGETAEFQVTNIPDQTPERIYRIRLTLTDAKGNVVKQFNAKQLKSTECSDVTFTVPAAELLKYQLVKPKLEITWDNGRYVSPDTFWAQELCATWNSEWQWAKHPLREQLDGVKAEYTVTPYENGLLRLKGKISSPVPLAQAEILDGSDSVWMADNRPALRENEKNAFIKLEFHGIGRFDFKLNIDVLNSTGARSANGKKFPLSIRDRKWNSQFAKSCLIQLPKNEIDKAMIKVNVHGIINETIPVRDIMQKHLLGFNSTVNNLTMVASRFNSQISIPPHIDRNEVDFDCFLIPADAKKSVFSLRVIDKKGNTWRGGVKSLYIPSGKIKEFNVYDTVGKKAVKVSADENLLTPFTFDFSPERGTVTASPAGRKYYGIMNGCSPLASGIGIGGSRYGSLPFDAMEKIKKDFPKLPKRDLESDGSWSLTFDKLSHVSLPLQVIPMFAGHRITMQIWVDKHFKKEQNIFGSGSHGFMLSVINGTLQAKMFLWNLYYSGKEAEVRASSKNKLIPGQWNNVEITFDQQYFIVSINGTPGEPVKTSGFQMRPKAGVIGCGESLNGYFTGKIKNLSINAL